MTVIVKHPRIVVGLPCFNEGRFLERTIQSLRNQSFSDFAVLITDNASTDDTGKIARETCAQDPRFHYVRHERNLGSAENFNSARALSESPYLLWLGAHDLLAPEALEYHMAVLDSRPEVSVSQSAHEWIDIRDRPISRIADGDLDWGGPNDPERYLRSIGQNRHNIGATSAIRRVMLDDVRFTGVIGTDRVILSHLAFRGPFADSADVLYLRRSFGDRNSDNPYMKRLTGRADVHIDWWAMARAYDEDFATLLGDRADARRLRRRLQLTLRYHLPVGTGTPTTTALWTLRRARKWIAILWSRVSRSGRA